MSLVLADPSKEQEEEFRKEFPRFTPAEYIASSLQTDCDPPIEWTYDVNIYPTKP
jgi:hypothetical protein